MNKLTAREEFIIEHQPFCQPETSVNPKRQREINKKFVEDVDQLLKIKQERCDKLINSIIDNDDIYLRVVDGYDREMTTCPLCDITKESTRTEYGIDNFPHKKECPYSIAKAIREQEY